MGATYNCYLFEKLTHFAFYQPLEQLVKSRLIEWDPLKFYTFSWDPLIKMSNIANGTA